MANSYFQFKQFTIQQDKCVMKVTTDGCLFGAWVAERVGRRKAGGGRLLDIGAGTGLLSLMVAQKNPTLEIDAIEIDPDAAKQAQANADASPWKENIFIMPGDAKDMAYTFAKDYDIIISNPPFYENELSSPDAKKNKAHHDSGLLLSDLLQIIKDNLLPDGSFYLLLPYKRHTEIRKMITEKEFVLTSLVLVRPTDEHAYFRVMLEGKLKSMEVPEIILEEIAVKDKEDQYTPPFLSLLKDYYLHL